MKSRFLARLGMTALSAALSALPALATTVAGTVMDSQGNPIAGAIVRLQLENCGAGGVCTLSGGGGIVSTLPVSTTTASDGTFSIVVNGNDALTPAGTFYEVRYIAQSGTIYSANYSITGTSFNLNIATPLGAMPPAPTPAAYTTVEQSGTTLQQRQLLNFTGPGISCADNTGLSRTDCTITAGSSSGITSLNGLSASSQTLSTGTSGTDFNIASAGSTHAFNFPNASASARGLVTSADWSTFNGKQNALSFPLAVSLGGTGGATAGTNGQVLISNGSAFAPGDPIVSGPDAAGVAPTKNPVQGGAIDNSTGCSAGPCVRSLVLANGAPAGSEYGLITRNIPSGTQAVSGTFWQATQPVSGTVTANQGGTWTVQPGNTANTTAWKVDGSAVTQPVSGTVTANAGTGTFNIQANASVNVAQIAAATAATGNGTSGAGNLRVNIASDNTAIANWGLGATGSAVPSGAHYIAGNGSGNLTGIIACDKSAFINPTTATTTQIVALVAGQTIRVCSYSISFVGSATANTLIFKSGTGTACGTGTASLSPTFQGPTTTGEGLSISQGSGLGVLFNAGSGNALCATTSAATNVGVFVTYTQF